jgi:putative NIF3 family GTP cyclohydrolase 1 type 2
MTSAGVVAAPGMLRGLSPGTITAQEVVDRIRKKLGGDGTPDPVESFKAGDPTTVVTGIATTSLPTLEVLKAAVKGGANMVIACEPTFFSKGDTPTPQVRRFPGAPAPAADAAPAPPDPVFTGKAAFIKDHNLVIYRLNDQWRARNPNPFCVGLADVLGWSKYANSTDPSRVTIPETSLDALVMHTKQRLRSRGGLRIIGNPQLRVRTVGFLPGSTPIQAALQLLPQVDSLLVGEVREWETVEYVRDTVDLGGKKSLIYVGRTVSEDPGMKVCAEWLATVVPEVRTTWHTAGDPYWRPKA